MNIQIKIVKDRDVFELFNNRIFIARWEELAKARQKVTVQQEAPFATTWYRIYSGKYQPILILGYDENKALLIVIYHPISLRRDLGSGRYCLMGQSLIFRKNQMNNIVGASLLD